jgi:DNA-binding response OmpR family regulator
MSAGSEQALPAWAEQSGFTQGIVAPITRGLDTVGVVYVLNKSTALPTLNEIEQLELVINFASNDSGSPVNESSQSQNQPFRSIEKTTTNATTAQTLVPIRLAGFTLNPESERMEMDGVLISLSPTEFMLMHTLASSPETPVSAVELMDRCWTKESRPADNAIDVAIFRLRKKLSKTSAGKGTIKTVRGSGYMFIPPASKADSVIVAD